jgi:outer membrane protein insertion porin family
MMIMNDTVVVPCIGMVWIMKAEYRRTKREWLLRLPGAMKWLRMLTIAFVLYIAVCGFSWSVENGAEITGSSPPSIFSGSSDEAVLDTVIVRGIGAPEGDALNRILLSRKGGILNEGLIERDTEALTEFLRKQGWWKAAVSATADTSRNGAVSLVYTVIPGEPAIFGDIKFQSKEKIPEFTSVPVKDLNGKIFTSDMLENIFETVISEFTENGYPDIRVCPSLSARVDTVDVFLTLEPGRSAVVDSIAIYGLTRTRDYVIRRELTQLSGNPAGQETVLRARRLLGKMDYVYVSKEPFLEYSDDGKGILAVNLTEGKQGTFDGVIGYQPSSDGEAGEMLGTFDLFFPNILGTGRSSKIRWEKLGEGTEDLELRYLEPWVLNLPYSVSLSFVQEQREKLGFTKTTMQASVSRDIGQLHSGAGYCYEKVSSDSLHSSNGHGINTVVTWEGIDNPQNPRSGIRYSVRWSNLMKRYRFGSKESHGLERLEFDLDHYIPSFNRQTVAFLVRYRKVDTPPDKLSLSDRYWLGGSSSIRGYREKAFPAVKALWASMEYRIMQGRASWVFVFADTGYLVNTMRNPKNGFDKKTINRTGYGFGIRIDSPAGTLGFDFGLGRGDSIGEGKLHVGLTSAF